MGYGISVTVPGDVATVEPRVREALASQGFGVLSEIDLAGTLRTKIGVVMANYKILGACNPQLAGRAVDADASIGLLLPCNVILRQTDEHTVVEAMDPDVMVQVAGDRLRPVADEAASKLRTALQSLQSLT